MICALNLPDGTIAYASGSSWAVVRDWARARYGIGNDDVQARHEAPEGVEVVEVQGPVGHDERRRLEMRGVRRATLLEAAALFDGKRTPREVNAEIRRRAAE